MWDSTYYVKQTSIVILEITPNNNEQNKKKNDVQNLPRIIIFFANATNKKKPYNYSTFAVPAVRTTNERMDTRLSFTSP